MMLHVPGVLTADQVRACRASLDAAAWVDGNLTSGPQAAMAKRNLQLPQDDPAAIDVGRAIVEALNANPLFVSAALPRTILPPLFNRYGGGHGFGDHIDNAIRRNPATGGMIRTDLSATLFLSEPEDYDGGELTVDDTYGSHIVKLPAGDLILYPASSIHRVTAITRGERVASFFWIQSLVRDDARRRLLFDMDLAVQEVSRAMGPEAAPVVSLTGAYHNLLRNWAEV
ncbi:Fe2+-dependent dioxygenase [Phenylobacterium sp.]|uniref:Fe2+-dependent dioxygenase n=1 Tax=Phenylobacterium sp. TaxID=1871053 RepID=UPI0025D704D8|nr:Fe2+-dependent dioxygenase [Phenylobacterium sp.]MBX3484710.1 Fe2+-dependent dioxygenase [Phenylobacterium sp.]